MRAITDWVDLAEAQGFPQRGGAAPAVRLLPGLVEEEQKSLPRMSANQQSIYQIIIAPNEDKSNELGVL